MSTSSSWEAASSASASRGSSRSRVGGSPWSRPVGSGTAPPATRPGKVSALQGERYLAIEKALSQRAASRYAESQLFAMHHLAGNVERLHLDCGFSRQSAYLFAETADELSDLTDQVNASRRAGIDVRQTLATGLPFPTAGAARLTRQVGIDPLAYVDALADKVVDRGGSVLEGTKVVDLHEGRPHTVVTAGDKTIRADHVVIATHFPAFDRSLLFPRLHPRRRSSSWRPKGTGSPRSRTCTGCTSASESRCGPCARSRAPVAPAWS